MECFKGGTNGFWYFELFTQSGRAVMVNTGGNFSENLEWSQVTQSRRMEAVSSGTGRVDSPAQLWDFDISTRSADMKKDISKFLMT